MSERTATAWLTRHPEVDDAETMAEMHAQIWREAYRREGDPTRNEKVDRDADAYLNPERIALRRGLIENAQHSPNHEFFRIAIADGDEIAGFLYGTRTERRQELHALYVAKKFHGLGVAQDLVEEFLAWCDKKRPVELGVVDDNIHAQRFYEKMGFRAIFASQFKFNEYLIELTMIRGAEDE